MKSHFLDQKDPQKMDYLVPPNRTLTTNYVKSTNFGRVLSKVKTCPISKLPVNNEMYSLFSKEKYFGENGLGYDLIFKDLKFSILFGACIVFPVAFLLLMLNLGGGNCIERPTDTQTAHKYALNLQKNLTNLKNHKLLDFFGNAITDANKVFKPLTPHTLNPLSTFNSAINGSDGEKVTKVFDNAISYFSKKYILDFANLLCTEKDEEPMMKLPAEYNQFCKEYGGRGCIKENLRGPLSDLCWTYADNFYKNISLANGCSPTWFNYLSTGNRADKYDRMGFIAENMPYIFQLLFYLIMLSVLVYQAWHHRYLVKLEDSYANFCSISVLVTGIPMGARYRDCDIETSLRLCFLEKGYTPHQISICYDVDEIQVLRKRLKNFLRQKEKIKYVLVRDGASNQRDLKLAKLERKCADLEDRIEIMEKRFAEGWPEKMIGSAFICLENEDERDDCLRRYDLKCFRWLKDKLGLGKKGDSRLFMKLRGESFRLRVEPACDPSDVIWEDLKFGEWSRFFRRMVSLVASILIIIVGFLLIYKYTSTQVSKFVLWCLCHWCWGVGLTRFAYLLASMGRFLLVWLFVDFGEFWFF